jgi:hypothetical protein
MTRRKLLIWIPLIALLLNGVGYLIVRRSRTPALHTEGSESRPAPAVEQDRGAMAEPQRHDDETRGLARRKAGLAALEAGDYEKALVNFTEARVLLGDKANVAELMRLAEDLRKRPSPASPPRPRENTYPRPAARFVNRPPPRRVATREEPSTEGSSVGSGLIIVTTTPRGLLVHVDDSPVDMRATVRPGSHHVALFDGDRKVYETSLDVKEGATATLFKDFPAESSPAESQRTPAASTPVLSGPKDDSTASEAASPAAAARPVALAPIPAPLPERSTGTLQIASPGLYGVVWVNGRPRGYPPLEVRDLPVGSVKVEVRVNGVEKRSSMVVVQPGLTTSVMLRALETIP